MANTLISVIVCTYNRSRTLRETLDHLRTQEADGFDVEVVVVDNHSTDDTKAAVASCEAAFGGRLRYVFEPRQGKPYALNTGVARARGDVLAFTDDDTEPEADWLRRLHAAFLASRADCVYGKVLPRWLGEPPTWLGSYFLPRLGLLDYGDQPFLATSEQQLFIGANVAMRRSALSAVGPFNVQLGNRGTRIGGEEDTDLFNRLLAAGVRIAYAPDAIVHHKVPAERLRPRYFRRWHFDHGVAEAHVTPCVPGQGMLGIPFWAIRKSLTHGTRYLASLGSPDVERRLRHQMKVVYWLGFFSCKLGIALRRENGCRRS